MLQKQRALTVTAGRAGGFFIQKNKAASFRRRIDFWQLDGPLDLVGTEASGTSVHMARSSVNNRLNTLYIGLPGTVGASVGVGNLDTESYALATKITLSHSLHLLSE